VIDDTALAKKGMLPVGVARQHCNQLGKRTNCMSLVSLTLAHGDVPVALCLFLPDKWVEDAARCARAGVLEADATARSKSEIALSELNRVRAADVWFGTVLADAGYGANAAFRHRLDARGLRWAVGIPRNQKIYDADVQLVLPSGRARKPAPDKKPRPAEDMLAAIPWRRVTWREGTKGKLAARFTAARIRVADGAVWASEQAYPQLKGELGLDHFEGRSWTGLHRHALMTCIAYAFLQHLRLAGQFRTEPGENAAPRSGTATIAQPARDAPRHHRRTLCPLRSVHLLPALQSRFPAVI